MSDQFLIKTKDVQTAEAIQQELASLGIKTQQHHKKKSISFGARISAGPINAEITGEEILFLLENLGPAAVNALFNTLEKFKDRVILLVNGEDKDISQERMHSIFAGFQKK